MDGQVIRVGNVKRWRGKEFLLSYRGARDVAGESTRFQV